MTTISPAVSTSHPSQPTLDSTESSAALPLDVLRRHANRGPRYTSYPPATAWNDAVGAHDLIAALDGLKTRPTPPPLSAYVHMPFCPSMCWFCACNVLVTPRTDLADDYLDRVEKELERLGPHLPQESGTVQIHWGGGSPSYLTPKQMERLFGLLTRWFHPTPDAEIAIEVDPRITGPEHLETLRALGFNRLSMGVQDFEPSVQAAINRLQPAEMTGKFIEDCRKAGFDSLNVDLIYGLPGQTPASFTRTLEQIVAMGPDRLAVYGYAHVPWMKPFQRKIDEATVPGAEARFALFRTALDHLLQAGYEYVGMDHFSRPDDELAVARREGSLHRNFMGYSTRAGAELIGIGLSSISFVDGLYVQNEHKLNPYYKLIDEGHLPGTRGYRLNADDEVRADVIQQLMCKGTVDKAATGARHGVSFDEYFSKELEALGALEEDGLVIRTPTHLETTFLGRVLVRPLAMVFDAHLKAEAGGLQRFSQV